MMNKSVPPWWKDSKTLKDWWWAIALVCGGIVLWGGIPPRLAKAEQQIDDLKGWAREVQGYAKAQHEQNRQQQQLQQTQQSQMQQQYQAPPNARVRNIWEEQNPDGSWWCCDAETSDCNDPYSPPWYRCD